MARHLYGRWAGEADEQCSKFHSEDVLNIIKKIITPSRDEILRLLMESCISLNDLQIVIRLLDVFTRFFILMGEEKLLARFLSVFFMGRYPAAAKYWNH